MVPVWTNVTAAAQRGDVPGLEDWFWAQGAVSVTVEDGEDNPIYEPPPGEQPLWDAVLVTGLFEGELDEPGIKARLNKAGFELAGIAGLEDRQWEREWMNRFRPMQFGQRLWVCPSGYDLPAGAEAVIHLDPGLAFGTGTHETTRLCLEYLDTLDVRGWRVIDFGCGSGVLGIGAALLGANEVLAIDNDPQALTATQENAGRKGVVVTTGMPGVEIGSAELVFPNILAQPLIDLSAQLLAATRPGGTLILSGIMEAQRDWVVSAYTDRARLIDEVSLGGWMRLVWQP